MKDKYIKIRVTQKELEKWTKLAKDKGITLSELIRSSVGTKSVVGTNKIEIVGTKNRFVGTKIQNVGTDDIFTTPQRT